MAAIPEGGNALHPISFVPGCNTPAEQVQAQLHENIHRDIPWLEMHEEKRGPLAIVAGGPSLAYRWPEIPLYETVMALNGAYGFLRNCGISPRYFMMLDARAENVSFLSNPSPNTTHYLAAQCHPSCFDALEGFDARLYLTVLPGTLEAAEGIKRPKVQIAGKVGTVGIKSLCLAYALGYREIHLFGYDSSYREMHHAFPQKLNDNTKTIDIWLEGKQYVTSPTFAHQAAEFCETAAGLSRNFGMEIHLHCDGLLPHMVEYSNRLGEIPIEIRERAKYRDIWQHAEYRDEAPGKRFVRQAIESLGMKPGESVIDYGAGTGRAASLLKAEGMHVTAVDFVPDAFEFSGEIELVEACLWELPDIKSDWAYCTDVMEHIPSEKVAEVLCGISKRTRKGAFFNISTRADTMGRLIGRKLHMTVMTADAWEDLLSRYWRVEMSESESEATFVCVPRTPES